jgi:hypothetical protein
VQRHPARHPDPDRRDLALRPAGVGGHPHPAATRDPDRGQAQVGTRVDEHLLDPAHVGDHVDRVGQRHDRVPHELAGPVPGDPAAPVDVDHLSTVDRAVVAVGPLAGGVHARVLQQQDGAGRLAGHHGLVQPSLLLPRGQVVDHAGAYSA